MILSAPVLSTLKNGFLKIFHERIFEQRNIEWTETLIVCFSYLFAEIS